jgi:hypothetical protein
MKLQINIYTCKYLLFECDQPGYEGEGFDPDAVTEGEVGTNVEAELDQRGKVGDDYPNITLNKLIKQLHCLTRLVLVGQGEGRGKEEGKEKERGGGRKGERLTNSAQNFGHHIIRTSSCSMSALMTVIILGIMD